MINERNEFVYFGLKELRCCLCEIIEVKLRLVEIDGKVKE